MSQDVSRRGLIGAAGAGAAAAVAAAGAMAASRTEPAAATFRTVPFFGSHQAGITTAAQDRMHFAAFDVNPSATRADLVALLKDWTLAAARMTRGEGAGPIGPLSGPYDAPPDDTGEAIGLDPGNLTITIGFGPTLFTLDGWDRFGLAARKPDALARLPLFPADALVAGASDGDLCVQACSDDPQVAVHAIRNLTRIAFGRASLRWSQLGFGRTSSTTSAQVTPRNLFGFKDGTASLRRQTAEIDARLVQRAPTRRPPGSRAGPTWWPARSPCTSRPGTAADARAEGIIGAKAEGAPLSGGTGSRSRPLPGRGGTPVIDERSHLALAHPQHNDGVRMLRRGYNYVDGSNTLGRLAAGLFFVAFVTDPRTHYIPMQTRMASSDRLSEYLQHIGSGLWAVPPGAREGEYVGQALFG